MMLAIFAFSTTPTKFLHQLFANHTDFATQTITNATSPQLNVSGIDCHCNSLVVIAPFVYDHETLTLTAPLLFPEHGIARRIPIYIPQLFFFKLRGPPALV